MTVSTRTCPHCANPVKRGYKFCRFCGAKLRKQISTSLFVGLFGGLFLVAVLVSVLTYLTPAHSPQEEVPEPLAREAQATPKSQTQPLEPTEVSEEASVDQEIAKRPSLEVAEVKPSKKEPSRRIDTEKDLEEKLPQTLREEIRKRGPIDRVVGGEKTQQEVAVKKEVLPSSPSDLPVPSSPPGEYRTIRSTVVFAEPKTDSERVTMLDPGTRVMVVGSKGDWLEVRSRHGRPPGFIRRDNAMFIKNAD